MGKYLVHILIVGALFINEHIVAQNNSYTIIYDQVYPRLNEGNYFLAKSLFEDLKQIYNIDPAERVKFSRYALENGDIDYFKSEQIDLIKNYGYFFTSADTIKFGIYHELLKKNNLLEWLIDQTNQNYPLWVKENPDAFFMQQKILAMTEANKSRYYFYRLMDYHNERNDSLAHNEVLKYLQDFDFTQLYEIIEISRNNGLPNNFDFGYNTYYQIQIILTNNMFDKFNFERTWHHIFPLLEMAYFDGKISNTFLFLYDEACEKHYNHQYYGTLENVTVKDSTGLKARRIKFGLF